MDDYIKQLREWAAGQDILVQMELERVIDQRKGVCYTKPT